MKKILLVMLAGLVALLAACSTPASRIKKQPDLYNRLSQEQQDLIRNGEVGVGFSTDMVKLALGEPDSVRERRDSEGLREIWIYATYETSSGVHIYRGHFHRGFRYSHISHWDSPHYRVRENLRIFLKDGKVEAVEKLKDQR